MSCSPTQLWKWGWLSSSPQKRVKDLLHCVAPLSFISDPNQKITSRLLQNWIYPKLLFHVVIAPRLLDIPIGCRLLPAPFLLQNLLWLLCSSFAFLFPGLDASRSNFDLHQKSHQASPNLKVYRIYFIFSISVV